MKQLLLNIRSGEIYVHDIPIPTINNDEILIRTKKSLISSGTEKMLINFGKQNYLEKARGQPEKFKMVMDKIKNDGLIPTYRSVKNKLEEPMQLGYCNIGEIIDLGKDVTDFKIGDRVISNSPHAEFVVSKKNLTCKVDNDVNDDDAVFTVLASISLQAVRSIKPEISENYCIIGAGLVGIICGKLLETSGCNVTLIDNDVERIIKSKKLGLDAIILDHNIKSTIENKYLNKVDGVIISASTESNTPIELATDLVRNKGKIISVGKTAINISYNDFFKKELSFGVSRSYGPGRYDFKYEKKNYDYPLEYVRWTENRNFQSILNLLNKNKIIFRDLISKKYRIDDFKSAYEDILKDKSNLGVLFEYDFAQDISQAAEKTHINLKREKVDNKFDNLNTSFIGCGNYSRNFLIPIFKKNKFNLVDVVSKTGISGQLAKNKFSFQKNSTNANETISNLDNNIVVITTKHDTHAEYILQAMKYKKNIFVEKPMAINSKEIKEIEKVYLNTKEYKNEEIKFVVGFNRRFSPHITKLKSLLKNNKKNKNFVYTINAGKLAEDHWTLDKKIGGGRLIGEVCHFIDLLTFLSGTKIINYDKKPINNFNNNFSIFLEFEDNSTGVINYLSDGNKSFPKEKLTVFSDGSVFEIDNFKKMSAYGVKNFKSMNFWNQDKGLNEMVKQFKNSINKNQNNIIPFNDIISVSNICVELS